MEQYREIIFLTIRAETLTGCASQIETISTKKSDELQFCALTPGLRAAGDNICWTLNNWQNTWDANVAPASCSLFDSSKVWVQATNTLTATSHHWVHISKTDDKLIMQQDGSLLFDFFLYAENEVDTGNSVEVDIYSSTVCGAGTAFTQSICPASSKGVACEATANIPDSPSGITQ